VDAAKVRYGRADLAALFSGAQSLGAQSSGTQSLGAQSSGAQSSGAQSSGAQSLGAQSLGARRVVVAKGKKSVEFELAREAILPDDLVDAVLGPTGNLRAPAVRAGDAWLVGFQQESWDRALG